ncbi:MAG TPA: ABC transporter ATP-binding protein [Kiritimatiellia bacterium]|nr:ABC transporter ATP-binding protein [Kiritimatiellia bacterium]HMO97987.1 ABC transporter ATP-binding protein [Kiritimatiellia bacterium]HMP95338.1 ABC transporter ATP-binding protein [Kiritimatiellia bacterium]
MTNPREEHRHHVLRAERLHVHYGPICALHDVTLELTCGTAAALVGGNGAGKSTFMKRVVGLIPPSAGEVIWRGEPIAKSTHEIAYLPQRSDIAWTFPMTVRGLVELGRYPLLGPWRRFRTEDRDAVQHAMNLMRIDDLADRQIGALSGGQQQRAMIARALAQDAHVLLLDEPFAGLDQPSQELLAHLLRDLVANGHLVVASHHDLKTVSGIFDVVVLLNGTVIAQGPSAEVMTAANLTRAFGASE